MSKNFILRNKDFFLKIILTFSDDSTFCFIFRVKADDDRLYIEIDLKAPMIYIKGLYEGEGQYNALKINAYGGFNSTMSKFIQTLTPVRM